MAVIVAFLDVQGQIHGLQGQVSQLERRAAVVQAEAARQRGAWEVQLAAAAARIGGAHRDLITCADIGDFQRGLSLSGTTVTYGDPVTVFEAGQPWLPAHCINQ
jgi:hypothetical protein